MRITWSRGRFSSTPDLAAPVNSRLAKMVDSFAYMNRADNKRPKFPKTLR